MPVEKAPVVAVAGAAGFIGRALCAALAREATVIGLTRRPDRPADAKDPVHWRQTDLFSLLQTEDGVRGAEVGVYLVHSMLPASRLTQGSFQDIDFILADNFARAARRHGLKRIIYLGGLIPPELPAGDAMSEHLKSRLEVEHVLASYGTPVVVLRASLVIGAQGSSFTILERLVRRLPLMVCPKWTQTAAQPIALADAVELLRHAVLDPSLPARAYDIGGPDVLSYVNMMNDAAKVLGLKRSFVTTRFFTPSLSRLWLSLITQTPKALVYPLIASLRHPMVAQERDLQGRYGIPGAPFEQALRQALPAAGPAPMISSGGNKAPPQNTVCSIQRLPLPAGADVVWTCSEYTRWLPRFMAPFIAVEVDTDSSMRFFLRPLAVKFGQLLALSLSFSAARSDATRRLFYITGGVLSDNRAGRQPGRFEFRQVPGGQEVIVAILNFRPRLPWVLYKLTQARVHLFVMTCFRLHLRTLSRRRQSVTA